MEALFDKFANAHARSDGYGLSQTICPAMPDEDLQAIWKSCNSHSVKDTVRRHIQKCDFGRSGLSKEEVAGWTEVYCSYWKALGEVLAAHAGPTVNGKVSLASPRRPWCHQGLLC